MIKVVYRLKKSKDFRKAYQKGRKIVSPYLIMYFRKNYLNAYRIGFSISKKIGKAVIRNRIKRRLREICRLNEELFPKGWDIVFVARGRIKDKSFKIIENCLLNMIKKIDGDKND